MPRAGTTGVTDARNWHFKEWGIVRAVRFVAVCTILHYWRMRPEEWPPAFRMATQAVLIRSALNELLGIWRAMRIVTTRAGHLAFAIGHVRGALQLCPPHLVAL